MPAVLVAVLFVPSTATAPPRQNDSVNPASVCAKTYTHAHVRAAARKVFRHPSQVTTTERRKVRRYIRCARRPESRPAMRATVHRWKAWRISYRGYWRLSSERLSPFVHTTLIRLRACESGGRYRVVNAAGYSGAYQYHASTWARAQSWVGVPYRYRTGSVLAASKDHQDAVTGRFFFAHRNEWECKA